MLQVVVYRNSDTSIKSARVATEDEVKAFYANRRQQLNPQDITS